MTDLQAIRPLRDTNRRVKQLETQEAAPPSPLLVTYSNPQKDEVSGCKDIMASHLSTGQPRCSGGRAGVGEGSANGQPTRSKRPSATGGEPDLGRGTAPKRTSWMTRRYWRARHNGGEPLVRHNGKAEGWERTREQRQTGTAARTPAKKPTEDNLPSTRTALSSLS